MGGPEKAQMGNSLRQSLLYKRALLARQSRSLASSRTHLLNSLESGFSSQQHSMFMTLFTGPMSMYRVFSS